MEGPHGGASATPQLSAQPATNINSHPHKCAILDISLHQDRRWQLLQSIPGISYMRWSSDKSPAEASQPTDAWEIVLHSFKAPAFGAGVLRTDSWDMYQNHPYWNLTLMERRQKRGQKISEIIDTFPDWVRNERWDLEAYHLVRKRKIWSLRFLKRDTYLKYQICVT